MRRSAPPPACASGTGHNAIERRRPLKRDTLERIARALNDGRVPFIVVGGVAVAAHGYGRSTQVLDLVIRLEPQSIRSAFAALATRGYRPIVPVTADAFADAAQRARWIAEKGMVVLSLRSEQEPGTPVDLLVTEPFDFEEEYRRSMIEEIAPGVPLRIVRRETRVRLTLAAGRPQDLADVAQLRAIHGESA